MMVIVALLLVGALLAKEAIDYESLSLAKLMEYAKKGGRGRAGCFRQTIFTW